MLFQTSLASISSRSAGDAARVLPGPYAYDARGLRLLALQNLPQRQLAALTEANAFYSALKQAGVTANQSTVPPAAEDKPSPPPQTAVQSWDGSFWTVPASSTAGLFPPVPAPVHLTSTLAVRVPSHFQSRNYTLALSDGLELCKLLPADHPRLSETQALVGLAYLETGNPTSAMPHFEKALKLNPDDLGALMGRARCYRSLAERAQQMQGGASGPQQFVQQTPGTHERVFLEHAVRSYTQVLERGLPDEMERRKWRDRESWTAEQDLSKYAVACVEGSGSLC